MPSETVELRGHILDDQALPRVLDLVLAFGGEYKIDNLRVGHARRDPSFARVLIEAPTRKALSQILEQVTRLGAVLARQPEVKWEAAPKDGVLPDDFYATTNLPTEVFWRKKWIPVENAEMDCGLVRVRGGELRCVRMHKVRKGDFVAVGHEGIRVEPLARQGGAHAEFEFMSSAVSSEKPKLLMIREIARRIRAVRHEGRKVLFVGGPAIVHTGAASHLQALIEAGFVDLLFTGNALAAHDIEAGMFGTSLGVSLSSGHSVEHGHENHLRAINRIRRVGSIAAAVKSGLVADGVMAACVRKKVQYVLVGSIRDDGPLPDVITDMPEAQDAMRALLPGVGVAIMVGTMLTSIAVGNMLPSSVWTVCVDINPAVVTKLADRGTAQALGLVTDAELFLRTLSRELGLATPREKKPSRKRGKSR